MNTLLCDTLALAEIVHLGASKNRAIFWGAVKIAAAAAENRAIFMHSGQVCLPNLLNSLRVLFWL